MTIRLHDTLSNLLVNVEQLLDTTSHQDGISTTLELSLRHQTALLTQSAGILLKLPQETIAQAIIILQRFYVGGGSYIQHSPKVGLISNSSTKLIIVGLFCSIPLPHN